MTLVTLYTKPDCHLCVEALEALREVARELAFELEILDITSREDLHRAYFERIPVVALDGEELFDYFVDRELLRERLKTGATQRRESGP
jgi:glutaredoxin